MGFPDTVYLGGWEIFLPDPDQNRLPRPADKVADLLPTRQHIIAHGAALPALDPVAHQVTPKTGNPLQKGPGHDRRRSLSGPASSWYWH